MNKVRHSSEIGDIKQPVVSGTVVAGKTSPIHAEHDRGILKTDIVNDLIIRPLHKCAVNSTIRLESLDGHTSGEGDRVLLGNTNVKCSAWKALAKFINTWAI
jgi:hypothetical protein